MVEESTERRISTRQAVRIVVVVVLVALVVAFAVDNSQRVEVGWLFGSGDVALWVVIVLSAVVGAVVGYVAARRHT